MHSLIILSDTYIFVCLQADHDHGEVWPPPKGAKQIRFMSMVKEPSLRSHEVNGIMVGYSGHVPRARDKVGSSPVGKLPNGRSHNGFPPPETTSPEKQKGFGTQTSMPQEVDRYVSTAHKTQFETAKAIATGQSRPTKLSTWNQRDPYVPRYSGHIPGAKEQIGGSVYGGPDASAWQP